MSKKKRRRKKHKKKRSTRGPTMFDVVYEDGDLIVIDKPAGLLTIATDKRSTRTAYHLLNDYVRKGVVRSKKKVHIVHRLDQATSGVLVFATSRDMKLALQDAWEHTEKTYIAVARGLVDMDAQTVTSNLAENRAHNVYSTKNPGEGRSATTGIKVIARGRDTSLLEIDLVTGRKHQIRVHLADIGHPVVGDKKYGESDRTHKRLMLHAARIAFDHPVTGERLEFAAPTPPIFDRLSRS